MSTVNWGWSRGERKLPVFNIGSRPLQIIEMSEHRERAAGSVFAWLTFSA